MYKTTTGKDVSEHQCIIRKKIVAKKALTRNVKTETTVMVIL